VNNLPKVVAQLHHGQDLNPQLLSCSTTQLSSHPNIVVSLVYKVIFISAVFVFTSVKFTGLLWYSVQPDHMFGVVHFVLYGCIFINSFYSLLYCIFKFTISVCIC